jgi:GNAT superfamily N-acetyltransferase
VAVRVGGAPISRALSGSDLLEGRLRKIRDAPDSASLVRAIKDGHPAATHPGHIIVLGMNLRVEFKKAIIPEEIESLCEFDRRAFHAYPNDVFTPETWSQCESYWMSIDGKTVGCSALKHNVDYDGRPRRNCLYILSTGVLPEFQNQGFGTMQKEWQIEYARHHGFAVIVTNMRQSNAKIIHLNQKLGFQIRKLVPNDYHDPDEPAIVMELQLISSEVLCPRCGNPLRTARAKQCRFCHADWH